MDSVYQAGVSAAAGAGCTHGAPKVLAGASYLATWLPGPAGAKVFEMKFIGRGRTVVAHEDAGCINFEY